MEPEDNELDAFLEALNAEYERGYNAGYIDCEREAYWEVEDAYDRGLQEGYDQAMMEGEICY